MNLANLYEYILLLIATVGTLNLAKRYRVTTFNQVLAERKAVASASIVLAVFFTLLIGLRPMGPGLSWMWADSANYNYSYNMREGAQFFFDPHAENLIWDNLFDWWASNRLGITPLFLLGDAIYFGCTYAACRKWFPRDTTMAYLVFLGAFSTFSYSYNGVKAGIAGAIFLLGLAYFEKRTLSVALILISWGFHHSMQMPVAAYILTLFYKNPKWYFYGYAFCVVMSILHVGFFAGLFASMSSDERGAEYLLATGASEDSHITGFRPDFLLYSAMPIFIGYKIVMKEKLQVSKLYSALLHMYICTNGIWCLCMYASYSNRIAYLSWFMYPFVLIYPFLKEDLRGMLFLKSRNQYVQLAKVASYHLYFTLFMELVFYKFIK